MRVYTSSSVELELLEVVFQLIEVPLGEQPARHDAPQVHHGDHDPLADPEPLHHVQPVPPGIVRTAEHQWLLVDDPNHHVAHHSEYQMKYEPFITGYITIILLLFAGVKSKCFIERGLPSPDSIAAGCEDAQQAYHNQSHLDGWEDSVGVLLCMVTQPETQHVLVQHDQGVHQQGVAPDEVRQAQQQVEEQEDGVGDGDVQAGGVLGEEGVADDVNCDGRKASESGQNCLEQGHAAGVGLRQLLQSHVQGIDQVHHNDSLAQVPPQHPVRSPQCQPPQQPAWQQVPQQPHRHHHPQLDPPRPLVGHLGRRAPHGQHRRHARMHHHQPQQPPKHRLLLEAGQLQPLLFIVAVVVVRGVGADEAGDNGHCKNEHNDGYNVGQFDVAIAAEAQVLAFAGVGMEAAQARDYFHLWLVGCRDGYGLQCIG